MRVSHFKVVSHRIASFQHFDSGLTYLKNDIASKVLGIFLQMHNEGERIASFNMHQGLLATVTNHRQLLYFDHAYHSLSLSNEFFLSLVHMKESRVNLILFVPGVYPY